MSIWDKLMGTRQPSPGVGPASAADLGAALLALNRSDAPWRIRRGGASDRCDIVAEWDSDPALTEHRYSVFLSLDEARHIVNALDTLSSLSSVGGGAEYAQGNVKQQASDWVLERDENGRRRFVKKSEFDTGALKNLLQETVTASGWTWKGRARRQ